MDVWVSLDMLVDMSVAHRPTCIHGYVCMYNGQIKSLSLKIIQSKSDNLFRTGARWDFPEQLAGRSYNRKPKMRMHIITIPLLQIRQIRQISEMAGAACHGEGYQCPARWMSLTRVECHSDGGPRGGSEGETSCTSFWRRAVHAQHRPWARPWNFGHRFHLRGITAIVIFGKVYICEAGRPNQCHVGNFRHVFFYIFGKGSYSALQSAKN